MGIFSRTRDIIAANVTDLLDRAEDPEKMIRQIIFEMNETLVEVRASAARTIAATTTSNRPADLPAGPHIKCPAPPHHGRRLQQN